MKRNDSVVYIPIILSFTFAFCFMLIPIPQSVSWLRPELVSLLLIYWVINLPSHVGIGFAFLVGVLFDLLTGMLLGSMGLTLSIIAFLALNLRMRLKIYRYWQQFAIIMLLIAFGQLIRLWIQMFIGHPPTSILYWLSSFTSALVWPLLYLVLPSIQRTVNI